MRVAAVILAGGEGRRIGGGKPLKALGGQSLIERAEALAGQWSDIVAVAVRDPAQVGAASAACILDDQGIEGPLGGLAAALRFARHAGREAVLTVPVDMPFLPPDLGAGLHAAIGPRLAAVAATGILAAREDIHGWVKRITWPELRSALVLLAMTFIVLPVVPDV